MRYFIQMTLSGSTMYVLYMAVKFKRKGGKCYERENF